MAENEEVSEEKIEEGSPAIVLRKVDVIIQDSENGEPRIIKAQPEDQPTPQNQEA